MNHCGIDWCYGECKTCKAEKEAADKEQQVFDLAESETIEMYDYVYCEGCEQKIPYILATVSKSDDDVLYFCKNCLTPSTDKNK